MDVPFFTPTSSAREVRLFLPQHFVLSAFLIVTVLVAVWWNLTVVSHVKLTITSHESFLDIIS